MSKPQFSKDLESTFLDFIARGFRENVNEDLYAALLSTRSELGYDEDDQWAVTTKKYLDGAVREFSADRVQAGAALVATAIRRIRNVN